MLSVWIQISILYWIGAIEFSELKSHGLGQIPVTVLHIVEYRY